MRQKDTSERGGGGGGRRPCVSLLMVTLSMQMVVCLVALVLFVLSSQWAQTILCALTVMMSCATLIGTIKKNYAIISVYLFIQVNFEKSQLNSHKHFYSPCCWAPSFSCLCSTCKSNSSCHMKNSSPLLLQLARAIMTMRILRFVWRFC